MKRQGYHGTDATFDTFDESFFGQVPARSPNGMLGVWVFTQRKHAIIVGKYVKGIIYECKSPLKIAAKSLLKEHVAAQLLKDGRSYFKDKRERFLKDGIDVIDVVEEDGSVGMSIIVNLACILDVETSEPLVNVVKIQHDIKTVPRDGRLVIVGDKDDGEYVMRWDSKAENALFRNVKGMWVAPDSTFTWNDADGYGPTYWRPHTDGKLHIT